MTLRLTPGHRHVLALVRDRQITWRASTGPFGGFALADGSRIQPSIELVALYELRNAELITVNKLAGHVTIASAGMGHLADQRGKNRRGTAQAMAPRQLTFAQTTGAALRYDKRPVSLAVRRL